MISPYTAVGLVPTVRGIRRREDIKINLEHLAHLFKAASWLSSLDLPVRLIAIPEGARARVHTVRAPPASQTAQVSASPEPRIDLVASARVIPASV